MRARSRALEGAKARPVRHDRSGRSNRTNTTNLKPRIPLGSSQLRQNLNAPSVVFSPDGLRLAWASMESDVGSTIRIHDVATGRLMVALLGQPGSLSGLAFSPDGKRLLSVAPDMARVWDAETGNTLLDLKDENLGGAVGGDFIDDRRSILTVGAMNDGYALRFWSSAPRPAAGRTP